MRRSTTGYGHYCKYRPYYDWYEIGWTWDKHYPDSRLRYPRTMVRSTDEKGAKKFCKKWGLEFPA